MGFDPRYRPKLLTSLAVVLAMTAVSLAGVLTLGASSLASPVGLFAVASLWAVTWAGYLLGTYPLGADRGPIRAAGLLSPVLSGWLGTVGFIAGITGVSWLFVGAGLAAVATVPVAFAVMTLHLGKQSGR